MSEINAEQLQAISEIASGFDNFYCLECAQAIQDYLTERGIHGKRIKLYTGAGMGRSSYIYDDSFPREAISTNGRHEAIKIAIESVEMVFDNHHPVGLPREQWMSNLQFYGKIHLGQQFQVTEKYF